MAALFAATYPEATHSVALFHPWLGGPEHQLTGVDDDDLQACSTSGERRSSLTRP